MGSNRKYSGSVEFCVSSSSRAGLQHSPLPSPATALSMCCELEHMCVASCLHSLGSVHASEQLPLWPPPEVHLLGVDLHFSRCRGFWGTWPQMQGILGHLRSMVPWPQKPSLMGMGMAGWGLVASDHRCLSRLPRLMFPLSFLCGLLFCQKPTHPSGYGFCGLHLLLILPLVFEINPAPPRVSEVLHYDKRQSMFCVPVSFPHKVASFLRAGSLFVFATSPNMKPHKWEVLDKRGLNSPKLCLHFVLLW